MSEKKCPLCGEEFTPKSTSHEELGNLTQKICVKCIKEYNLFQKKTYEFLE
ncbi:MAG: hypothetical protein ACOC6H_03450 [Thermoproteota archaeon]